MSVKIKYSDEARNGMKEGIDLLEKAVKATLGPGGRNVGINKPLMYPFVTKDGVTVAKEVFLTNELQDVGAQIIKEASTRTCDTAGDGTTTSTILAASMYNKCLKYITSGANPLALKRGIDKTVKEVCEYLTTIAKPISTKEEIAYVAAISANNDLYIGNLIAEAMTAVGKDGVVMLEEDTTLVYDTKVEVVSGFQFDRGAISPYMILDEALQETVLDDPYILIYDEKISNLNQVVPILQKIYDQPVRKPLLIIADDVVGEGLTTLIYNLQKAVITAIAVKAPGFGDKRKDILDDLAACTGGKVISPILGIRIEDIDIDFLGGARKVIVKKNFTTILEGKGDKEVIRKRIKVIEEHLNTTKSMYEMEKLQERRAKLASGIATIKIGALTEIEWKAKQARIEDALAATYSAIEEGVVAGGGIAYIDAQEHMTTFVDTLNGDEKLGAEILLESLEEPFKLIMCNAGYDGPSFVDKCKTYKYPMGFDAQQHIWVNMFDSGVLDSVRVVKNALTNAASVATTLSTTECVIIGKKVQKNA